MSSSLYQLRPDRAFEISQLVVRLARLLLSLSFASITIMPEGYDYLFKLLLIGDSGVGKVTQLLKGIDETLKLKPSHSLVCCCGSQRMRSQIAICQPLEWTSRSARSNLKGRP